MAALVYGFSSLKHEEAFRISNRIGIDVKPGEFDLSDTTYFELVKNFIMKNGTERRENVSSIVTEPVYVTYRTLHINDLEASVDHSNRIYFTENGLFFGNILKESGTVKTEMSYGVPLDETDQTQQKERVVLEAYRELIVKSFHTSK